MTAKNKEDTVQQLSVRITVKGETLQVESGLKITSLPSALSFLAKIDRPIDCVSFSGAHDFDSSAIVFLLACQRKLASTKLKLAHLPERLSRFLALYGLSALFDLSE